MVINGFEFLGFPYGFVHRFSLSLLFFIFKIWKLFLEPFPTILKVLGEGLELGLLLFKLQVLFNSLKPRDKLTVRLAHSI